MKQVHPELPKELLPVGKQPAIQYAVEEGVSAGLTEVILVISRRKEIVKSYFEDRQVQKKLFPDASDALDELLEKCNLTFLYQDSPTGESDAIYLARDLVGTGSIAAIYPDNLFLPSGKALSRILQVFVSQSSDVTGLVEVSASDERGLGNAGRVDLEPVSQDVYRVTRLHPKGDGHFVPRSQRELRACGISIRGPGVFDYIDRARSSVSEGEELTDGPVHQLMLEDRQLLGVRLDCELFDVGNPRGYEACQNFLRRAPSA